MIDYEREGLARIEVIKEVINHPNADRLDIIRINEWQCVAQKGTISEGDVVVYFEIDAILPIEVESKIFGKDSKVRLSNSRVKTIKLRGSVSQGLVVPTKILFDADKKFKVGKDLTKELGIGKYVPTPKKGSVLYVGGIRAAGTGNDNFAKMRKPSQFKTVGGFEGKGVMITEKIHGTSFVAGWIERESNSITKKLNKFLFGKYEFCYRSMNVQLQKKDSIWNNTLNLFGLGKKNNFESTVYGRTCIKYSLQEKLAKGEVICGEIYGYGIQDNYSYGLPEGVQNLVVFGARKDGKELIPAKVRGLAAELGLEFVPVLYVGPYNKEEVEKATVGPSVLDPKTKVREGCVINTLDGEAGWHGTCLVKSINPAYLLGEQSEFN